MVSLKRTIAGLIVCFKPHVLLTLCILLVIAHSVIIAIQKGASNSWRVGKQHDFTLTMTTLILIVALIWAAFFIFIVRFELRNELDSLLILFQCSKRGLRFMGVVGFHVGLLTLVSFIVSATVERSIPRDIGLPGHGINYKQAQRQRGHHNATAPLRSAYDNERDIFLVTDEYLTEVDYEQLQGTRAVAPIITFKSARSFSSTSNRRNEPITTSESKIDRQYLLTVYKIWLTAIVYAFLYLVIENLVMFYVDMSLVEFVHVSFLAAVAKLTGIDLSDYSAGEMLFNPLMRHRIR